MKPLAIESYLRGLRVLITGHTGFTGTWMTGWLQQIGCELGGISLAPQTCPAMFTETGFQELFAVHRIIDIRDSKAVHDIFEQFDPHIVFHLAAQPIVSVGYSDPYMTFETNVMGTLNVLEAATKAKSAKAVVCVTTDKVYKNQEWAWGYREVDPLGGEDPYSASKSACEMVVRTYQKALAPMRNRVGIAAARGGNIIGGGDWAENRIVPDFVRAASGNGRLEIRKPSATRPWQHVLALIHGYIQLGGKLFAGSKEFNDAWNFGPAADGERPVSALIDRMLEIWPGVEVVQGQTPFKESHFLSLSSEKAYKQLGWKPALDFSEAVEWTARWYRLFYGGANAGEITVGQISDYRQRIREQK